MSSKEISVPFSTKQSRRNYRLSSGRILTYTIVFILALIYIVPMLIMVNTSFKTSAEFMTDPASLSTKISADNYLAAWEKANFAKYIGNTLLYTVTSTLAYIFIATFIAFPISRRYIRGSQWIFALYLIALFLPNNLIPQFQFMLSMNLYNTQVGYIILTLTGGLGILILVGSIQTIPRELDEAAAMDGCGYFQYVVQILMPLIKPALATVALLHAIGIWNDIILPMIYLTNRAYYPVTRGLMAFYGQFGTAWNLLSAAIIIMIAPLILLFIFLQRYIIEGALRGSIKG